MVALVERGSPPSLSLSAVPSFPYYYYYYYHKHYLPLPPLLLLSQTLHHYHHYYYYHKHYLPLPPLLLLSPPPPMLYTWAHIKFHWFVQKAVGAVFLFSDYFLPLRMTVSTPTPIPPPSSLLPSPLLSSPPPPQAQPTTDLDYTILPHASGIEIGRSPRWIVRTHKSSIATTDQVDAYVRLFMRGDSIHSLIYSFYSWMDGWIAIYLDLTYSSHPRTHPQPPPPTPTGGRARSSYPCRLWCSPPTGCW